MTPAEVLARVKVLNNKKWRVASVHGMEGHKWCWLVNVANPADQCRFSLKGWAEL